jgi:hypothetical protein
MQRRAALHEVHRRLADLGAVHHEPNVIRLRVPPARLETIKQRLLASLVAVLAKLDALLHVIVKFFTASVGHGMNDTPT